MTDCTHTWVQSVASFLPHKSNRLSLLLLLIAIPLCFSACCTRQQLQDNEALYVAKPAPPGITAAQLPVFYVKAASQSYNKIGTPEITEENGVLRARVSSVKPTLYYEQANFTTAKETYTNLIYRIHFSQVPFGLCNLNITTGNNPGLLIIYTLNHSDKLLLITTVHTCGCYLAFFPTAELDPEAYPPHWPMGKQSVYGYTLPGRLPSALYSAGQPYFFTLESGNHRISNVTATPAYNPGLLPAHLLDIQSMENLYHLPYQDNSISFFENEGRREGYVKDNSKILERLLISWWAFDWHVGEDKAYGIYDSSKTPFYTSLKFWQRKNSDMKNFPQFLSYWGWAL